MMKNKIFNKTDRWVKRLLPFILLVFLPLSASAVTKAEADSAYAQEHYQKAVQDYEQLLKKGVSADLYYNLGNSYYRLDNITQAIIAYERALRLAPGDQDIRFNLQMARSKTIDRITPESEMFFVTWYRSLVSLMSGLVWLLSHWWLPSYWRWPIFSPIASGCAKWVSSEECCSC